MMQKGGRSEGDRLWWWKQNQTALEMEQEIQKLLQNVPENCTLFAKSSAMELVKTSLEQEDSWPGYLDNDQLQPGRLWNLLDDVYEEVNLGLINEQPSDAILQWNIDGVGMGIHQAKKQFTQQVLALHLLLRKKDPHLNFEFICGLHRVMVEGAVDGENIPILAGAFRTESCYSQGSREPFHFTAPGLIRAQLQKCLDTFNDSKGPTDYESIAKFMERFLSIHPFQDGNGRLTRLLAAWLLMRCIGMPWMVPIPPTKHGKEAKARFMYCLLYAGRVGNLPLRRLKNLLVESCWASLEAQNKVNMN